MSLMNFAMRSAEITDSIIRFVTATSNVSGEMLSLHLEPCKRLRMRSFLDLLGEITLLNLRLPRIGSAYL
jgi:hypothetical protein